MLPGEANGFKVDAINKILQKYLRQILMVLKTAFFCGFSVITWLPSMQPVEYSCALG